MNRFEEQFDIFYHQLSKQGYIDRPGCTSLPELKASFQLEFKHILQTPRFVKAPSIQDQWNIVSTRTFYDTENLHIAFEFVFELHYHHCTLQLKTIRVLSNAGLSQVLACNDLFKLPTAFSLIEKCRFRAAKPDCYVFNNICCA